MNAAAPWHAHIYYTDADRAKAAALRELFRAEPCVRFVGQMAGGPVGPHPIPQFEIHFFEPARDAPHHEHLLCTVCGKVREFRDERLERMTTIVAEGHGYARLRHRLVIYGVCDDCQRGQSTPARLTRR